MNPDTFPRYPQNTPSIPPQSAAAPDTPATAGLFVPNAPLSSPDLPSTDTILPDARMARQLMHAYYSELEAVSSYLYDSIMLERVSPALSALCESLAETEARHFTLLGKAIRQLDGDPVIHMELRIDPLFLAKHPEEPQTAHAIRQTLHRCLTGEQSSAREYRLLAARTPDPALSALLAYLSQSEERHIDLLQSFKG